MEQKRHIFLCGERGVGKSTLIRRLLEASGLRVGGFCTKLLPTEDGLNPVYIHPASQREEERSYGPENRIAYCDGQRHRIHTEVFDTVGASLLRPSGREEVMVMDELGFMESQAHDFTAAVFRALDGPVPVLAAVKNRFDVELLNAVRAHPAACLVQIDPTNREELYERLLSIVMRWKKES